MAENTSKVYPGGGWYNDTALERYNHVMVVLKRFQSGEYDTYDLKWFIKNAILSRVYISQGVHAMGGSAWKNPKNARLLKILYEIHRNRYATDKAIDIRKFFNGDVRFEHVIPSKVALEHILDLFGKGLLTFEKFKEIRSKLYVCIVTKDEEQLLSGKFRQTMPTGWTWSDDPFARYDTVGVTVYGRP